MNVTTSIPEDFPNLDQPVTLTHPCLLGKSFFNLPKQYEMHLPVSQWHIVILYYSSCIIMHIAL